MVGKLAVGLGIDPETVVLSYYRIGIPRLEYNDL
jgi:hypothetical protein